MNLVEKCVAKKTNKLYDDLDRMAFLSKNLYNQALYRIRQHFFHSGDFENQVVFDNIQDDTKVYICPLYGKWCVMNTSNPKFIRRKNPIRKSSGGFGNASDNPKNEIDGILYYNDHIDNVIKWVATNYEQYRKQFAK